MKEEFIEECWFIYGVRTKNYFFGFPVYHSAGSSGHVEFDWKKALHPLLLGWIHTHPGWFGATPSETDNSTMAGWVRGRDRPMICGILCKEDQGWFDYYRDSKREISHRVLIVEYTPNFVWGKF
jgi:hypothetical protein